MSSRVDPSPGTPGEVLALVREGRARSRADLRRLTGLSRTAVDSRLAALAALDLVLDGAELASTGGRPAASVVFDVDAGAVLAAAIGRSRSQLAVTDLAGAELAAAEVGHAVGSLPDAVLPAAGEQLGVLLDRVAAERDGVRPPVLGVGVSLPGTVDPVRGVSVDSPVMSGWDGVDLAPPLLAGAGLDPVPVLVANDADVLARSERLGHAAAHEDLLVVKASTGLGLGILAGGRVVSGHLGGAGEIGHTRVDAAAGRPCRCGAEGCLETIAAGWALVASLQEQEREDGSAPVEHVRDLVAAALAGDPGARALLRESGRRLGEVLAVAINLLNPRAVVLGGDMAAAFDVYSAGVRETVYARSSALATRDLVVLPATHGDRAGVVGSAALALDHVLSPAAVDARVLAARATPSR